jgi:hypothetical protein
MIGSITCRTQLEKPGAFATDSRQMLESYCSQLEHRVVERFDAAVEAADEDEQV